MLQYTFDISSYPGLSEAEAARRFKAHGPNELPSQQRKDLFRIILEVLKEPMLLLLLAGGTIYFVLGERREALMLLSFVFLVIGITIYQERKTERALEALREMASPRAQVIREGRKKRVAGREVVLGDTVVVSEGDRVPADAKLGYVLNLSVDESMLTGESVPVRKQAMTADVADSRPGGDDLPFLYSGSLVVSGFGVAEVTAVGQSTEMGKIGKSLALLEPEETILQKETNRIVKLFAISGLAMCLLVVVMFSLTRGSWLSGMLAGISLAMAVLPEEFPVVLTIFLALGAWRMSRRRVLVRRVPALEMLGAATVLCVDKTGTLTQNRMTVARLFCDGNRLDMAGLQELPEHFHRLVEYAILASQKDPFDPMEKAIRNLGLLRLTGTEHLHGDWELVQEYPLSRSLLAMSHVWKARDDTKYLIAAKGAPEAIIDLCHLSVKEGLDIMQQVGEMADSGLRVLGVAMSMLTPVELPGDQHEFAFAFLGLVGLHDPIRPDVPAAIESCYTAGLRPIMITGDYPGTATTIATAIGLSEPGQMLTGSVFEDLDDRALAKRLSTVSIFARAVPEQKLRIVNSFKSQGEIVAMTGDGVNDAPALKSAHIGISMGSRGTDVAREASSIVLLDDDFASIVHAIRTGRRIYENIKKALAYIVAVHVPIAGLSLLPVFLSDWPLILLPVHIVFLELIIDPACTIVFEMEPEEENIMRRRPRDTTKPLFSKVLALAALLQGISVLVIVLGVLFLFMHWGHTFDDARTVAFSTLVLASIGLILTNRSWDHSFFSILKHPNKAFWWIVVSAVSFLWIVLYTPHLRSLFHFEPLHALDVLVCFGAGVLCVIWFEAIKMLKNLFVSQ